MGADNEFIEVATFDVVFLLVTKSVFWVGR